MGAAKPVLKSNVNETDLIARAVCKDEAAIREIIKNNNSHLYRIARSVLHDNGEAEDVLQESYVKAFAALAKFRGDSSLKTWLSRIVLNECLQRLRNPQTDKSRMDELRPEAQIIQFPYSTDQPLDPERNMAQRELVNLVEKAVDRLPGEFRLVLVARTMEGLSIEDTANLLGLKPETVKTRLFRARKLLKEALAEHIEPLLNDTFPFMGLRCEHMADVVVARMCRKQSWNRELFSAWTIQCCRPRSQDQATTLEHQMKSSLLIRMTAAFFLSSSAMTYAADKPTDPQIAHIAYTAGVLDVKVAEQALKISKNKDVLEFATNMVTDHTAVNEQALALVKKLGVTPEDNDVSKGLVKQADAKFAELSKLSGAEFDKAYVTNEVAYHHAVNGALADLLIPSSSNAELKSLLETGLKIFQGHEMHAQHVAEALK